MRICDNLSSFGIPDISVVPRNSGILGNFGGPRFSGVAMIALLLVEGSGFRVQGLRLRVWGLGLSMWALG